MPDGHWHGLVYFNDRPAETISPFLSQQEEWSPKVLKANANQSFQGSIVLGLGFTMSEDEAQAFIAKDPKNAEVLFPYLNGEDLNSSPEQKASRWVINFFDWPLDRDADSSWERSDERKRKAYLSNGHVPADYPNRVAADFPELLAIVEEKVKPERESKKDALSARKWWLYLRPRPELYHAIGRGACFFKHPAQWENNYHPQQVLAITIVSKTVAFAFCSPNTVFSNLLTVFSRDTYVDFALLQSNIHVVYAWQHSSKMKSDLRYCPADSYETFPFPVFTEQQKQLEDLGYKLYVSREQIMLSQNIGLTAFYKLYHNRKEYSNGLEQARQLQREIDLVILDAYGWNDIDLAHGFHAVSYLPDNDNIRYTISESARVEILKRLSKLNHDRWEEEQKV